MGRCPTLLTLCLLLSTSAAHADAIWTELPFAGLMRKDLTGLTNEALAVRAEALRTRLFIDEETVAIERGEDLELAIGYAAIVALIGERDAARAGLAGAQRSAAFVLHTLGDAAETSFDLKIALTELSDSDSAPARALVASVKAAREVGATRFAAAFGNDPSVAALVQAGRIALREGRPADAATHYMTALAKQPLPRLALAAFEALLRANAVVMAALAERLEGKFVAVMPAMAPAFAKLRRVVGDERASTLWRDDGTIAGLRAEVWRRLRMGRVGAAETLARAAERLGDRTLMAAVGVELGRALPLAEANEPRLVELVVAAEAKRAIGRLVGKRSRGELALDAALDVYEASATPGLVAKLRLLAALARQTEGTSADAAWQAFVAAPDKDLDAAMLGLFAALVRDRWQSDVPALLASLAGPVKVQAQALALRTELGLALRARDAARLDALVPRLTGDDAATVLARVVGARAREVVSGAPLDVAGLARDRQALGALAFAFDETSLMGQRLAQARAFTLAVLAGRANASDEALELLREARRFGGALAGLAGGVAQLLAQDGQGAFELCERTRSEDRVVRQALATCEALGRPSKKAWRTVERQWDDAGLPPILQPGTARPLFVPEVMIGVEFEQGLRLVVSFEPVSALVPELLPARSEVQRRAE